MPTDLDLARRPEATLPAPSARSILLVKAFEEADEHGSFLSPGERAQATRAARSASGPAVEPAGEAAFLLARAELLLPTLAARAPYELRRLLREERGPRPAWILIPTVLIGLLTNAMGPSQHINVLAVPLFGLLLWNLGLYALILWGVLRHPRRALREQPSPGGLVARGAANYLALAWRKLKRGSSQETVISAAAGARFLTDWVARALPILSSRLLAALHLGAAGLAAGVVAGMYQRGLLSRYMATWESTFLSPDAADQWLRICLAPARWILGLELPSVREFTAPEVYPAGDFIHAWALSAGLIIFLPRLLLWARESRRLRRLEARVRLPLDGEYYRALLSQDRGLRSSVRVLPYSYQPEARRADNLRALLHDVFGARAEVTIEPRIEYGSELGELPRPPAGEAGRVRITCLLFALAQSPEVEVHADFLSQLRASLAPDESMGVLLDASSFCERLHGVPEAKRRLEERRRAWDRVVREAGLEAQHLDLDRLPPDALLTTLPRALWPNKLSVDRPA